MNTRLVKKLNARAARRAFFIGHSPLLAGALLALAYALINSIEKVFA